MSGNASMAKPKRRSTAPSCEVVGSTISTSFESAAKDTAKPTDASKRRIGKFYRFSFVDQTAMEDADLPEHVPIADPIDRSPTIQGEAGRAWKVNLTGAQGRVGISPALDSRLVFWVIECPWANPAWHSYALVLVHLRDCPVDASISRGRASHELWLHALDPRVEGETGGTREKLLEFGTLGRNGATGAMMPMHFAAQINEPSDEAALARIERAVVLICNGELSPDADFWQQWVDLFGNDVMKKDQGQLH